MLSDLGITRRGEMNRSHWAIKEVHLHGILRKSGILDDGWEEPAPPLKAVPAQIPQAFVFGGNEGDPITLIDPPNEKLNETDDQRQTHAVILEKTRPLISSCGFINEAAFLKDYLSKLLEASGTQLQDLQVCRFWLRMNSIRRRAEVNERLRSSANSIEPLLPEGIGGALVDLVRPQSGD
jgi:hypothetical protein